MIFVLLFALLIIAFWIDNAVLGMLSIVAIVAYSIYFVVRKLKKKRNIEAPKEKKRMLILA